MSHTFPFFQRKAPTETPINPISPILIGANTKQAIKRFLLADKNVLLAQSEKCFARKFDIQKDKEILLTLQQRIHQDDTNI